MYNICFTAESFGGGVQMLPGTFYVISNWGGRYMYSTVHMQCKMLFDRPSEIANVFLFSVSTVIL